MPGRTKDSSTKLFTEEVQNASGSDYSVDKTSVSFDEDAEAA